MSVKRRADWHDYFLNVAQAVAARGDCSRRQVGAVIVDGDHRIIATGYNGTEPGGKSCLAGECPRAITRDPGSSYDTGPGACIATHAEANALLFARASVKYATLYVTHEPCDGCLKLITAAGVTEIHYPRRVTR